MTDRGVARPGVAFTYAPGCSGQNADDILHGLAGILQVPFHGLQANHCRANAIFAGHDADISAIPALPYKMPPPARLPADKGYDANSLRERLTTRKTKAVIPSTRSRKTPIPDGAVACIGRNLIARAFCRLKHWRRIAPRYDNWRSTSSQPWQLPLSFSGGPE